MVRFEAVPESISMMYTHYEVSFSSISMAMLARFETPPVDITLVATENTYSYQIVVRDLVRSDCGLLLWTIKFDTLRDNGLCRNASIRKVG